MTIYNIVVFFFVVFFLEITDTMLTGYCLAMLLEGFETTSGLMSHCLYEVYLTALIEVYRNL